MFQVFIENIRRKLHDILRWGYPTERAGGDTFQPTYGCKFCDGELAQDSTGAWFHLTA